MPEVEEVEYDIRSKIFVSIFTPRIWCWQTERQQGCNCRAYRSFADQYQGRNAGRTDPAKNRERP